ncbi:anthranilate synthase component I family protein [Streptomyces qaidamensis]|uniref:anthranilate synthase component I family protein n=1 Tax=Streptomyces qaidamensis TaxID=1783515 RepID=UPI00099FB7A0|nr:anthranilate synthase component I family protein [Streptomyces qaidamensis]
MPARTGTPADALLPQEGPREEKPPEPGERTENESRESSAQRLDVRVTTAELPPHAPFDLYALLRQEAGEQDVFLTESPVGPEQDHRPAVVGCGRLAEVRVYAHRIEVDGLPELRAALLAAADTASMTGDGVPGSRAFHTSAQVWDLLERARTLFRLDTGVSATTYAFGFLATFSYEAAWHMEELPPRAESATPDVTLTLFRDTVWYDRDTGAVQLRRAHGPGFERVPARVTPALAHRAQASPAVGHPEAPEPRSVRDSVDRATFLGWAATCLEHIRVGDIYQIQIGHRIDVETDLTPVDVYRRLRGRNPSPYMYLVPRAGSVLIGASPELYLRIEGDRILMRPIAGTTRRGPDAAADERNIARMVNSRKERAEHIMLVDLCRNDIGRVSEPGTLPVDRLMSVESFSHVFHLVSTVSGWLRPQAGPWDAIRATFPAGTMSGAPKIRAMEIIDGLEEEPRGAYAGAVGLVDVRGWSELALCIRSVVHDGRTYATQSSAGMVADSDPAAEWAETLAKMAATYWALTGRELHDTQGREERS